MNIISIIILNIISIFLVNIISIIFITQIPILGASALFAAGSVVMGIAKSKEVRAYGDEDDGQ